MINRGMLTSATPEWATPRTFFDALNVEFGFTLDVCATDENAKCGAYYTRERDGLNQSWTGMCWCNPPYGREIGRWVERAHRAADCGEASVVMLVPARTDTAWWHEHAVHADEIRFVRGRLRFNDGPVGAPFPSAVLVFRQKAAVAA